MVGKFLTALVLSVILLSPVKAAVCTEGSFDSIKTEALDIIVKYPSVEYVIQTDSVIVRATVATLEKAFGPPPFPPEDVKQIGVLKGKDLPNVVFAFFDSEGCLLAMPVLPVEMYESIFPVADNAPPKA